MFLQLITARDVLKDSALAGVGFSPVALLTSLEPGLILGILNLVVVIVFRVIELRMKARRRRPPEE
ncbi:MAG TPA: hypothetical protein VGV59_14130 [Pyrinomonadaceae bacterium]|nr:hypothetical protein [Pyrinomonadaceae bacterium]